MSQITRQEILERKRHRYERAGKKHKTRIVEELVELFGYRKNDNAHVEQKNYTQVRLRFGYQRYDNPNVVPLLNALCKGALHQLLNYFLPTMKLEKKERVGSKVLQKYGPAQTPLSRVLACAEVSEEKKQKLAQEKKALNPFALLREVERQLRQIEALRRVPEP